MLCVLMIEGMSVVVNVVLLTSVMIPPPDGGEVMYFGSFYFTFPEL